MKRERKFRRAYVTGNGWFIGVYQREAVEGRRRKSRSSEEQRKEIVASRFRAIKIEIGRSRGCFNRKSAFTHLRRFLSGEITSRVPTLSRGVPLEIPNECVEVETLRETRDAKFHGLLRAKIAGAPRKAT